MDILALSDEQFENLTVDQINGLEDFQLRRAAERFSILFDQRKLKHSQCILWWSLRNTQAVDAEIRAGETLSAREDWLKWYCYNMRRDQVPELTHDEYEEVFRLIKQPFSLMRERLGELMSARYWPLERSLVLYDIEHMTFPVRSEDGALVSQIMQAQLKHYDQFIRPHEGLKSQWDDEDWDVDCVDDRTLREKLSGWLSWKFRLLTAPFRKPWPPRGIDQLLSGSIYEQSPDALIQIRFKWGTWNDRIGTNPDLAFIPMKPLEHYRFGYNGKFLCYHRNYPMTCGPDGNYPWCELLPILENSTGNDADWRFKEGFAFEYCLKNESEDSSD